MTSSPRPRRQLVFRIAAVLLALTPFALAECLCRIVGWGQQDLTADPFVGFASVRPLFTKTPDRRHYHTAPDRLQFFREDQFAAEKTAGEFRVFVFGGSTVQGHPFSIETSFPTFLQQTLETAQPERTWEVINCGGVSYASYRLLPIVAECLKYQPDLFVFCSGQNEFLEDVAYAHQRQVAPLLQPLWSAAAHLQSFRAAVRFFAQPQPLPATPATNPSASHPLLPAEVHTRLDQPAGLELFHRDDRHARDVAAHYQSNLRRLIGLCRQQSLPLLVIQPPINLSDCPPFKSEYSEQTTEDQRLAIRQQLQQASQMARTDTDAALRIAHAAVAADPRLAIAWYELGQLELTAGNHAAAADAFQHAVDEDVCPLRMTSPLQQALQQVIAQEHTPFLNAHALLAARCTGGIVGEQVLVDHVHPSFRGHEEIAIAIAEWMTTQQLLVPTRSDWRDAARASCRTTVQTLDDSYFLQGRRRLQVLKNWAAGRATLPDFAAENENRP
ncbi:MAG: hypothetical protein RL215_1591 [Planctomycetota bacterium]